MKKLLFLAAIILPFFLSAQTDSSEISGQTIEDIIEEIAANSDQELDYSDIYDDLLFFYNNKINLNSATREQLGRLHFLSEYQIDALLYYRYKHGDFISIYELQLVPGFSSEDIRNLLPFVTVAPVRKQEKLKFKNVLKYGKSSLIVREQFVPQTQKGYAISDSLIELDPDRARYLGDRQKIYARYKFAYRDRVQAGITMEKDAGEQFFSGAQKYGFDFYSAHLQLDRIGNFNRIVAGDFQGQFGEGLVLWNGMAMSKSAFVLNIKKKPQGLRRYSSTDENRFFRGAGVTYSFKKIYVSAFASYKKIDGNAVLTDTLDDEAILISALQTTGYHRTPSEIVDRHTIGESVAGGNVTYRGDKLDLGFTALAYKFSAELNRDLQPYQIYDFQGKENFNASLNWFYLFHDVSFFGEAAVSANGAPAIVTGLNLPLAPQLQIATLYRYYSEAYQAYYSNAFSEGTRTQNEQGLYIGIKYMPIRHWAFSFYVDNYSFPWMRSRIYEPLTGGTEYFAQVDYNPTRSMSMYLRFKTETKAQNSSYDSPVYIVTTYNRSGLRYNLNLRVNSLVTLKTRVETSLYKKDSDVEKGYMMYQDVQYRFADLPLSASFRFAMFDAPYNARIYAYENDVLYAFSIPAYMYQGFRTYLLVKYDVSSKLTFWVRYAQTTYTDRDVISPGSLTEIDGNTKSEIKIQLRYKF